MTPREVETITYVPEGTIVPSRPTTLEDFAFVVLGVVAVLAVIYGIWRERSARRVVRRARKQVRAIGVAAVGMASRIEETRKGL